MIPGHYGQLLAHPELPRRWTFCDLRTVSIRPISASITIRNTFSGEDGL
jgi:hypothetical protein